MSSLTLGGKVYCCCCSFFFSLTLTEGVIIIRSILCVGTMLYYKVFHHNIQFSPQPFKKAMMLFFLQNLQCVTDMVPKTQLDLCSMAKFHSFLQIRKTEAQKRNCHVQDCSIIKGQRFLTCDQ